jgi:hypothetical protein
MENQKYESLLDSIWFNFGGILGLFLYVLKINLLNKSPFGS